MDISGMAAFGLTLLIGGIPAAVVYYLRTPRNWPLIWFILGITALGLWLTAQGFAATLLHDVPQWAIDSPLVLVVVCAAALIIAAEAQRRRRRDSIIS